MAWLLLANRAGATPNGHVPRAYGATLGTTYAFRDRLPTRRAQPWGAQLGARFGWQVSGLDGGAPGVVGVEMDVLIRPAGEAQAARDSYAILYGFFMKHSFFNQLALRPFLSYGLGAAQIWVREVDGRGIGHATRLGVGVERRLAEQLRLSIALTYQGVLMPRFLLGGEAGATAKNTSVHAGLLTLGIWHGN
jgi:hypothetical protein